MAKFTYYIINHDSGEVTGTNEAEVAQPYTTDDGYCVIVSSSGHYKYDGKEEEIDEHRPADGFGMDTLGESEEDQEGLDG